MRTQRIVVGLWVVLLASVTLVGLGFPPEKGAGLPDDEGGEGASVLAGQVAGSTSGVDRLSVSLAPAVHDTDRLLVVQAPERSPYGGEARAMDQFLREGGTAIVFLATTGWNDVLADYGMRLNGALLLSTQGQTRSIPVELPEEMGGGRLVLVNATALSVSGSGVDTIVSERELVLDLDGDGEVTLENDEARRFPLVATTSVGEGQLIVVPSGEAVLGRNVAASQDALASLFQTQASGRAGLVDASMHSMGVVDAVRGPASPLSSVVHASPWAGLLALAAASAVVVRAPRGVGDADGYSPLDETTDETREWSRASA